MIVWFEFLRADSKEGHQLDSAEKHHIQLPRAVCFLGLSLCVRVQCFGNASELE
jgi:hypothetical protein